MKHTTETLANRNPRRLIVKRKSKGGFGKAWLETLQRTALSRWVLGA